MKVLYDYQVFTRQNFGGISRYFCELMAELSKNKEIEFNLPIRYSNNQHLLNSSLNLTFDKFIMMDDFLFRLNFIGKAKLYRLLKYFDIIKDAEMHNRRISIKAILSQHYDVFHPTYYNPYFIDHIGKKPFIITIYDMTHEIFSSKFPQYDDETITWKKELAKKAAKIIAISENTKKDIIKFYGLKKDKIDVIHLSSPLKPGTDRSIVPLNIPARYILFVGDRFAYKNFTNFIHAAARQLKNADLFVVCAGSNNFTKEESLILLEMGIEKKVLHYPFLDNMTLAYLYKHALCFVFPSLYEGFGIPILEAFTCGCPVVLSDSGAFPEVAGDAGIYFNPENIESIRESLDKVVKDANLRKEMSTKGFRQLSRFSSKITANKTINAYRSMLR
jgi:glycosyltransferase involved in cell wall biosynthesis